MDLPSASAQPRTIDLGGETFPVRPLTLRALGRLQAFLARQQRPDFLGDARRKLDGFPEDIARPHLQEAADRAVAWPPDLIFDSDDALPALTRTPEGQRELLAVALDLGEREAGELLDRINLGQFLAVMKGAFAMEPDGPKPEGGPAGTGGAAGSTGGTGSTAPSR
jgi:hypothetical protein